MATDLVSSLRSIWYKHEKYRLKWARRKWLDSRMPLVTVYVPTHNRAELLLDRALPSIVKQTYPWLDVIVAAHGCADDTVQRAVMFLNASKLPFTVFNVPRRRTYPPTAENHWLAGPVAPANAVLRRIERHGSGEWIARIDDDDEWHPKHIECSLRFAQAGDYEFVSGAYETHERTVMSDGKAVMPIGGVQTWVYRSYLSFMRFNPDCWRKTWNRVNDVDLAQRMRDAGVRIGLSPEIHASVLPRPGENVIGFEAYRQDALEKERHFSFDDPENAA